MRPENVGLIFTCGFFTVGYPVRGLYMQGKIPHFGIDTKIAYRLDFFQGHVSRPVNWYQDVINYLIWTLSNDDGDA